MKVYNTLILLVLWSVAVFGAPQNHLRKVQLMGCGFEITVVSDEVETANKWLDLAVAEITRIENLISSWKANSQTSLINRFAGIKPVKVDKELFNLIERALAVSKLTEGAFDMSYASLDKIWKFDGSMTELPSKEAIKQSVLKIGYQNIILNKEKQTIFLKRKGMRIGFGAIGKGYAADRTRTLLEENGVKSGLINASGDLKAWGKQADGSQWLVAITNPLNKNKAFSWLPVKNQAVVTSGNYEKYVEFNGVRYSHIIDPRTGYPATGVISVTIFADSAELADALATAVYTMGVESGLFLINQIPGVESIIIDITNNIHTSGKLKLYNPLIADK